MVQVALVTDNKETISSISEIFDNEALNLVVFENENNLDEAIKNETVDVILFDCLVKNLDIISLIRKFKLSMQTRDIRSILLLPEKNINYDILKYTNSYILRPFDKNLFLSTLNSNSQLRDTFRVLSKNNNDLAKSLYQLNVLYNTSTQLAGSLDKTKLIEIMTDGLEQSLSLSLCYALVLNEVNDIKLIIKSLFPISARLENAIKLRALLNYKNLFSINPAIEDVEVVKYNKDQFGEYDLNIFGYDNLFAPINIKNKFYGIIEVFRETDFAQDDTKCFTTLVKQVSLPLESAILYEEIKDTNIKLEKLERLKSEFISIVSHELRTPLTSINSALEIILKGTTGEINDAMEKFLNLAKRNVARLSAIIYDLLDLSKIEAGKMEFRFEKTNINLPVELVKNTLESLAKEQNITINLHLNKELENVYIDTQRMEQVLTNLVSNAIKFTKENGVIEVTTSKITSDEIRNNTFFDSIPEHLSKEYVQIAVKDNGIGIAKENWSKVFEQFKQIENSLSRKVGGSGLGLPIAKRLMTAHKGFIWLDSEINKGSTFYIAIPIMSEKEIFELSLESDIQKAKTEHINIALMALSEKIVEGKSLTDKILSEDVIRKTSVFKEYAEIKGDRRYYYSYTVDMDSFVFDFEERKLQTFIKANSVDYKDCDMLYSAVLYPQGGETVDELIKKLTTFSKGVMNEENINS
jgi:signal transduction histidine kinase